jgi:hypothetical protein
LKETIMAEFSNRYALPYLQVGQAQKEVTHNAAVAGIDALLHLAVETAARGTLPEAPVAGQAWIVADGATGEWAGHDGAIMAFDAAGWHRIAPREGCVAWLRDVQRFAILTSGGWRDDGWPVAALRIGARTVLSGGMSVVPTAVGGAVVDVEARAAIAALVAGLRVQGLVAS